MNNCLTVPAFVVGMLLLLLFVLAGNVCLGLCRGGISGRGITLRGMGVRIVLLIGVAIVVYVPGKTWGLMV